MTTGTCKHGEFDLREGCAQCIAERNAGEKVQLQIKVTAPDGAPEGEEEEVAGEIVKLTETIAEIQGAPKPETAITLRPGEDLEARGYFEEALKLQEYAEGRVIATVEDVKLANDDLSLISKLKKAMDAKRKSLLDPLKLQADAIRETYTFLMAPVLEASKIYRDKMLAYNAEQERVRKVQEEINRKRQEAAEQEMKLKGELSESVNLVEVTPEVSKSVSTDMGASGQRDMWKYEVVDFAQLPDAFKMVDNAQLSAIAKRHHDQKQVPGVRFYNEPIIANRAR